MKLLISKRKTHCSLFLSIIIWGLLFCGSYQGILPSYVDELFIIVLFGYICIHSLSNKEKLRLKRRFVYASVIYLGLAFFTATIRLFYDFNTFALLFYEIANNIKPLLVLIFFSTLEIKTEYRDFILKTYVILNIPSILVSLTQYSNREVGYSIGLKMRNGTGRIQGLAGHPITYGFILVLMIFVLLYLAQSREVKINTKIFFCIVSAALFFLLIYTQSRYPLALLTLVLFLIIVISRRVTARFILFLGLVFVGFLLVLFMLPSMLKLLDNEAGNVRMVGIQTGLKSLMRFPLLGTGVGTFGTESSFVLESYVYDIFNVNYNTGRTTNLTSGVYFETGFFQKIVENGVLGTIAYYYIFYYYTKISLKKKDYLDFSMIITIFLNSLLNPIYRLPGIFIAGICMAHLNYAEKNERHKYGI